jgi:hypothetical protein
MHRYIASYVDKENLDDYQFCLITADTLKQAEKLFLNYNQKIVCKYILHTLHLYKNKYKDIPVNLYISSKWIKFRNE